VLQTDTPLSRIWTTYLGQPPLKVRRRTISPLQCTKRPQLQSPPPTSLPMRVWVTSSPTTLWWLATVRPGRGTVMVGPLHLSGRNLSSSSRGRFSGTIRLEEEGLWLEAGRWREVRVGGEGRGRDGWVEYSRSIQPIHLELLLRVQLRYHPR
jgi:hypothetical protein